MPDSPSAAERRRTLAGAVVAIAAAATGVLLYAASEAHGQHDPAHELQQLDLLYLDEPAPGAADLGLRPGSPALVVFCDTACPLPEIERAQVVRSTDAALAAAYGLDDTGIALVDSQGRVRYRSYDPQPDSHEPELQALVDGVDGSG